MDQNIVESTNPSSELEELKRTLASRSNGGYRILASHQAILSQFFESSIPVSFQKVYLLDSLHLFFL